MDPSVRWGNVSKAIDFRDAWWLVELVVGAFSNTHFWGSCPSRFCFEPSYIIAYTYTYP